MMENDQTWVENLITIIERKPILYNKSSDEYADKERKKRAWDEVCEVAIENWEGLAPHERTEKSQEVQRRWKNLRTCFARELRAQKKGVACGPTAKKRRKYIYFDQLMFLLPTMEDREAVGELPSHSHSHCHEAVVAAADCEWHAEEDEDVKPQSQNWRHAYSSSAAAARPRSTARRRGSYEEPLLDLLQAREGEDIDEDKAFLLSLVPALRRMREDHKCEAKIEMLRICNRYQLAEYSPLPHRHVHAHATPQSKPRPPRYDWVSSSALYRSGTPSHASPQSCSDGDPASPGPPDTV